MGEHLLTRAASIERACGGNLARQGLEVASLAAALTNNNLGIAGVAPAAKVTVLPVATCNQQVMQVIPPQYYANRILQAAGAVIADPNIRASYGNNPNPAKIIVATTATQGACPPEVQAAITAVKKLGVSFIAAAGDTGDRAILTADGAWPMNCEGSFGVAGHSQRGDASAGAFANGGGVSNIGRNVAVSAPGQDLRVLTKIGEEDSVVSRNGSAYAAAEVAAGEALIAARRPLLSMRQVEDCLRLSARLNHYERVDMGEGTVDLARAMACALARKVETEVNDLERVANQVDAPTAIDGRLDVHDLKPEEYHGGMSKAFDPEGFWSTAVAGAKRWHRQDVDYFRVALPPGQAMRTYFESLDCLRLSLNTKDTCRLELEVPDVNFRLTGKPLQRLRYRNDTDQPVTVYVSMHQGVTQANAPNYSRQVYKLNLSWRPTPEGQAYL